MTAARWLIVLTLVAAFLPNRSRPVEAADFTHEVVDLTNAERIKNGLAPLAISASLRSSAQNYATTLATNEYVGHVGPNGSTLQERDEAAGYTDWDYLGEDTALGQTSAAGVVAAWLASPIHRANLLSPYASELGVGFAMPTGSPNGPYWVADFGDRPTIQAGS